MKTKRHDVNNTLIFLREGGKMKRIGKFCKKNWKRITLTVLGIILILCAIYISKRFFIAIIGLLGFTGLNEIEMKNDSVIDDLREKRGNLEGVKNEKLKSIRNTDYVDVDLQNNESAEYIEKRIYKKD
jgi:preprotein translocase subunit SecF